MEKSLIPVEGGYLVYANYIQYSQVIIVPGGTTIPFEGPACICLAPDELLVTTQTEVIEAIPLTEIESVEAKRLDGVMVWQETSLGPRLGAPPNNYIIEVTYSKGIPLKRHLRIMPMFANICFEWAADIERAAEMAAIRRIEQGRIHRRQIRP